MVWHCRGWVCGGDTSARVRPCVVPSTRRARGGPWQTLQSCLNHSEGVKPLAQPGKRAGKCSGFSPHFSTLLQRRRVPFVSCRTPARSVRPKVPSLANMDLNSSEDEDEPLPVTRVTEGVRVARTTRTGSTHITSDLVALPNPRPRSECGRGK